MVCCKNLKKLLNFYSIISVGVCLLVLGGLVVAHLTLGPRFAGLNPAEDDGFLRAIKIRTA
jgi:hypothetical protein